MIWLCACARGKCQRVPIFLLTHFLGGCGYAFGSKMFSGLGQNMSLDGGAHKRGLTIPYEINTATTVKMATSFLFLFSFLFSSSLGSFMGLMPYLRSHFVFPSPNANCLTQWHSLLVHFACFAKQSLSELHLAGSTVNATSNNRGKQFSFSLSKKGNIKRRLHGLGFYQHARGGVGGYSLY